MSNIHTDALANLKSHFFYGYFPGKDYSTEFLQEEIQSCKYPKNIRLHKIRLPNQFSTHHSKLMVLGFSGGDYQIVIHTANLIELDWSNVTNGVWISPRLKRRSDGTTHSNSTGGTQFQKDFIQYLKAYRNDVSSKLAETLRQYDFNPVHGTLIASVPGNYNPGQPSYDSYGIFRLKKELQDRLSKNKKADSAERSGYTVAQCSSIASLGPNDIYLGPVIANGMGCSSKDELKLVFPTVENVQESLNGYLSGVSLHFKRQNDQQLRQLDYMLPNLHQWTGVRAGRHRAAPHIKTYMRVLNNGKLDWIVLTSANLSKQAWGQTPKNRKNQWIQSWELGILLTPEDFGSDEAFVPVYKSDTLDGDTKAVPIRMAFDLPLTGYKSGDQIWSGLEQYDEPDWRGNTWPLC